MAILIATAFRGCVKMFQPLKLSRCPIINCNYIRGCVLMLKSPPIPGFLNYVAPGFSRGIIMIINELMDFSPIIPTLCQMCIRIWTKVHKDLWINIIPHINVGATYRDHLSGINYYTASLSSGN